jgi:hypothetical protein
MVLPSSLIGEAGGRLDIASAHFAHKIMSGAEPKNVIATQKPFGGRIEVGGLLPSSRGARVRCAGGKLSVTDRPFAEAKELIGGCAIVRAKSREEANEFGQRFMLTHAEILGPSCEGELEIRELSEPPDVGSSEALEFETPVKEQRART